jgi:hypothetical protein
MHGKVKIKVFLNLIKSSAIKTRGGTEVNINLSTTQMNTLITSHKRKEALVPLI